MVTGDALFVDGRPADMPDEPIALNMPSNILGKVDDLQTAYSYTYTLPRTLKNDRIFQQGHDTRFTAGNFYKWLGCDYWRKGALLLSGKIKVNEVTADGYACTVFWGLDILKVIKDEGLKLSELGGHETDYVTFDANGGHIQIDTWAHFHGQDAYGFADYDGGGDAPSPVPRDEYTDNGDVPRILPCVTARYILGRIYDRYGLTLNVPAYADVMLDKMLFALTSRKHGDGNTAVINWTRSQDGLGIWSYAYTCTAPDNAQGMVHRYHGTGSYVLSDDATGLITVRAYNSQHQFNVEIRRPLDLPADQLPGAVLVTGTAQWDGSLWKFESSISVDIPRRTDLEMIITSPDDDGTYHTWIQTQTVPEYTIRLDTIKDAMTSSGSYPIMLNLPEMTVLEFIGEICGIIGCAPIRMSGSALDCVNLGQLMANKKTLQLIGVEKLIVKSDYAQNNRLAWATDDVQPDDYGQDIHINDNSLDLNGEWFTSSFCVPDENRLVKLYKVEAKDNVRQAVDLGVDVPRVAYLEAGTETPALAYLTRSGLEWSALYNNYASLASALDRQKVITAHIRLTPYEFSTFDLAAAYYVQELAGYFAVLNIESGEGDVYEIELIKIKG